MSSQFTPFLSAIGGALIGLSASLLMLFQGRVAGASGILSDLLVAREVEGRGWRAAFVGGLAIGGLAMFLIAPAQFAIDPPRSLAAIAIGGLLVGLGARAAGGCTSGHGVCGVSRLRARSIVATVTFVIVGAITVFAVRMVSS